MMTGEHDFDFLFGQWAVQHRRLIGRLTDSAVWEDFSGSCDCRSILGGRGNIDDNLLQLPAGAYRAATTRVFDIDTGTWSIWWLDLRRPAQWDPPVVGRFQNGVGSFYADDQWEGRPIRVRFIWAAITRASAQWEQAFSADAGRTWETNWVMKFHRTDHAGGTG